MRVHPCYIILEDTPIKSINFFYMAYLKIKKKMIIEYDGYPYVMNIDNFKREFPIYRSFEEMNHFHPLPCKFHPTYKDIHIERFREGTKLSIKPNHVEKTRKPRKNNRKLF